MSRAVISWGPISFESGKKLRAWPAATTINMSVEILVSVDITAHLLVKKNSTYKIATVKTLQHHA